jgi:hypothetical protein
VRREASIEGVRFRCNVQALSRLRALLTHRNLSHAGWRLKRAFRFRKFFGYFLPKKVTTRTTWAQTLHSVCVTAWAVTPQGKKPAPRGIGGGVRREASIEGVRFRCNVHALSRLRALPTHRNLSHAGWRLKRVFRFRKVLWLLSSKESNNKNNLGSNTPLCLRHGMGRDAPEEGMCRNRSSCCRDMPPACPAAPRASRRADFGA